MNYFLLKLLVTYGVIFCVAMLVTLITASSILRGVFKPWIMKSSQGLVKHVIGC